MIKEFHRPKTIEETIELKDRFGERASFLAGGTEVNSKDFSFLPEHIISLEGLCLNEIDATEAELLVGACCTIQELIELEAVPDYIEMACRHIVNRNIRNMATIGGQLAGNQLYGSLIPVLVAIESSVDTVASGIAKTIPVMEYLDSDRDVLLTRIRLPKFDTPRHVAIEKYSRTANDLAIIAAAVALSRKGDRIERPVIAVGGVADHVVRLKAVEEKLAGRGLPAQADLQGLVSQHVTPVSDVRGGRSDFKKYLAGAIVASTIYKAYQGEGWKVQ